jgi:hypothetical protein
MICRSCSPNTEAIWIIARPIGVALSVACSICDGAAPRYVFIARSISAFRASSAVSFFLLSAISLLIARNSVRAFLLNRCSEPSSAAMYSSS